MKRLVAISVLALVSVLTASGQQRFVAALSGAQEVPANASAGKGTCAIVLNAAQTQITVNCTFAGLGSNLNAAHIHGTAAVGVNAPVLFGFTGLPTATSGTIGPLNFNLSAQQVADMRAHRHYVNLHSVNFPGGEIRGQVKQVNTVMDTDGDGRTDASIYRQTTNQFWSQSSLTGAASINSVGTASGDNYFNLTWDFDGDGLGDILLRKLDGAGIATWSILQSSTNTIRTEVWGDFSVAQLDTLTAADYDGDGKQDIAIFRRSTGFWWVIRSSDNARTATKWGTVNDYPSIGDYDGDGRADLTAVRIEGGQRIWYTLRSSDAASTRTAWGNSSLAGLFFFSPIDIDGDGKQDISIIQNILSQRQFITLRSSDGGVSYLDWGLTTDTPLFGDYDGDGKTDFVARRDNGGVLQWYILRSSDGALQILNWGITGDQ